MHYIKYKLWNWLICINICVVVNCIIFLPILSKLIRVVRIGSGCCDVRFEGMSVKWPDENDHTAANINDYYTSSNTHKSMGIIEEFNFLLSPINYNWRIEITVICCRKVTMFTVIAAVVVVVNIIGWMGRPTVKARHCDQLFWTT